MFQGMISVICERIRNREFLYAAVKYISFPGLTVKESDIEFVVLTQNKADARVYRPKLDLAK